VPAEPARVVLTRPDGVTILQVPGTDARLIAVRDLCYHTLHRPFGVTRNDAWNEGDPASTHLLALDGDRIAGYVRLILEGGGAHVRQVVVPVSYRGRGIASDLVSCAVARARELEAPYAYLNARERAVGVYERLGFRVTGAPFRMGRTFLPHVRMELRLR
jgi:ribosomal protein S18 acetylase RimI-like enzyme